MADIHTNDLFEGEQRFSMILSECMRERNESIETVASIAKVSVAAVNGWLTDHSFPHMPSFETIYVHYHLGSDLVEDYLKWKKLQKPFREREDEERRARQNALKVEVTKVDLERLQNLEKTIREVIEKLQEALA